MTPLHYAARDGYFRIVHLLIEKGANPREKTNKGKTALNLLEYHFYRGSKENKQKCKEILLSSGL